MGGLYGRAPLLAILFAIRRVRWRVYRQLWILGQIRAGQGEPGLRSVWIAASCLFTGIFTLLSMSKIWNESSSRRIRSPSCFWKPRELPQRGRPGSPLAVSGVGLLWPLVWGRTGQ